MQKFDLLFLSNVLSAFKDPEALLSDLAHNAEKGSRLVVIDWAKGGFLGPLDEERLIEDNVILMAALAGFRFVKLLDTGTFHYGLAFEYTGEKYHVKKK